MKVHRVWLPVAAVSAIWFGQENAHAQEVKVDLQPCIVAKSAITKDDFLVSEAYLFRELIKGFWGASQHIIIDTGDGELDLNADDDHGKCSAIFVGVEPSDVQYEQLTKYSAKFQVRVVYFFNALTYANGIMDSKLGLQQWWAEELYDASYIKLTGAASARVVNPELRTTPQTGSIQAMRVAGAPTDGTRTIVADLADENGNTVVVTNVLKNPTYAEAGTSVVAGSSVAAVVYAGNDGSEEMHVFFAMAWFDMEAWAWGHYILEWATQGIFQGERRFWLGAMVDDHFLGTNTFEYDANSEFNEGTEERISGEDLKEFLARTKALNAQYNSDIVTEFALNGFGILEQAASRYRFDFDDADAALLYKGNPPQDNGDGTVGLPPTKTPADWFNQDTIDGMKAELDDWMVRDDLLAVSLETKNDFYWQSHTLSHQARDNLGEVDCQSEDGGNSWIAFIIGLYGLDTYAGRSMTNPGITGLFNKNCLKSAMDNKITCAPGDNTWDNSSARVNVTLISDVNQFHSIYTTESNNGLAGFQIVPRFATYVYYNCRSADCLVLENLYIRRVECGCPDVNPGTMGNLNFDTTGCDFSASGSCPLGLQAFGTIDNLFEVEAVTTTRWIMNGRRDKYMFHQANVVPTDITLGDGTVVEDTTLLEYWYQAVLEKMALYLNLQGTDPFPAKSVIFDDLCTNFKHHEELDASNALVTITKTKDGGISGASLGISSETVSMVPITVPTTDVAKVSLTGLSVYSDETYGSDTTFYVASSLEDKPVVLPKVKETDLPTVPPAPTPGN